MRWTGIFLLLIGCFQFSYATVFFVSLSGNDGGDGTQANPWRTLKHAVSKVAPNQNHTIRILAGTFVEGGAVNVPAGVHIEGAGTDQTIIKSAASFYYNPETPGFGTDKFLINLSSSSALDGNQTLKGFTVDGDGKRLHGGIYVYNRNNVIIQAVKVQYTNFCGIWLWNVKNSAIKDVKLLNCSWGSTAWAAGALNLGGIDKVEIAGLNVDENAGYGIKALGASGNKISYLKIHDSRISVIPNGKWNNGSAPNISIELWSVDLVGCEIYDCYVDNHISLVHDTFFPPAGLKTIRVHHNVIDIGSRAGGNGYGLELTVNNAEVDHNYFLKGKYGIANWAGKCANWDIHHNVFYGISNFYPGETLRSQTTGFHNVRYYNNTVELVGTQTANVISSYGGASDRLEIKNNLIINSNTGYSWFPNKLLLLENGASVSGLQVQNNLHQNLPIGTVAGNYLNNITSDPKIAKAGNRPDKYYFPLAGSPLIDAGINIGLPFSGLAPDIGAYEYGGTATPPANALPSVALSQPMQDAHFLVGSPITITATATDTDGSINKVEFFNGSVKLGEDLSSPYTFIWDKAVAGNYSLSAKATDNQGGVSTSDLKTITVSRANTGPSVQLTAPANGSTLSPGSTLTLSAEASDVDGNVSKVEFFNGTKKLGEDHLAPYSFAWENVPPGTYILTATATDNAQLSATSQKITVTVTHANIPPVVSITSPTNNASYNEHSSITIRANATDVNGSITKVEFFSGALKVGEDMSAPYDFMIANVAAGDYIFTAKAFDEVNAASTSESVKINVTRSNLPPHISILSPIAHTTFRPGDDVVISAEASDKNGTVTRVEFFDGLNKLGEDLTSPYSIVWNDVPDGPHTIRAKATDNEQATAIHEVAILVQSNAKASAGEDKSVDLPETSIQLQGSSLSPDDAAGEYRWSQLSGPNTAELQNSNTDIVVVNNLIPGIYIFELTLTDAQGFSSNDQVTIVVNNPAGEQVTIPRYFTPNNDGLNDVWEWSSTEPFYNSILTIFNRAGQKVFEAVSYQNDWDGKIDGRPLQPDAYYYVIRLEDRKDVTGAVRIIR
jgi:gliding motility-associated-like protein